jgi:hypothetical protein
MGSELSRHLPGTLARGQLRDERREQARMDSELRLELARVDRVTRLDEERIRNVEWLGQVAMNSAARLSMHEARLAQTMPSCLPRVNGMANIATLAVAEILQDSARRVSR